MLKEINEPHRTLCGERIPFENIHAVSVSLPQLSDVIGYEERRTETLSRLKSGYPRFVAHSYIARILDYNRDTKKSTHLSLSFLRKKPQTGSYKNSLFKTLKLLKTKELQP